jgi:RNA polymerase sigma-70 factor (ECF subfamily)
MREVLEWPAERVAEVLELSVAAVNSALQRARAALREHLPTGRREAWSAREVSERERAALDGFIAAHEAGDAEAALAQISDDIRVTMPPNPLLYEGREAIAGLLEMAFGGMGDWRLVPTRANLMPAAASYLRAPDDTEFRAFKLDVLHVRGGKIAEITTFDPHLFPQFGLPTVWR